MVRWPERAAAATNQAASLAMRVYMPFYSCTTKKSPFWCVCQARICSRCFFSNFFFDFGLKWFFISFLAAVVTSTAHHVSQSIRGCFVFFAKSVRPEKLRMADVMFCANRSLTIDITRMPRACASDQSLPESPSESAFRDAFETKLCTRCRMQRKIIGSRARSPWTKRRRQIVDCFTSISHILPLVVYANRIWSMLLLLCYRLVFPFLSGSFHVHIYVNSSSRTKRAGNNGGD